MISKHSIYLWSAVTLQRAKQTHSSLKQIVGVWNDDKVSNTDCVLDDDKGLSLA